MGSFYQKYFIDSSDYINIAPKEITLLENLTEDSFAYVILNNTFLVFKSINQIIFLIYCNTNNSIICYDIEKNQRINEIKNPHDEYITNFRHYLDKDNKKDLIMTISLDDNNIRIWNLFNWECILNISHANSDGYLYSACFLYSNKHLYIISSNFNLLNQPEFLKIFDLNGKKINEIKESNDITYIIENYYENDLQNNYIITGNLGSVKYYIFDKNKLYNKYYNKENGTHLSLLIYKANKSINLIESCFDGNISIWNFHTGELIDRIKINKWLTGICLWNNDYLFVGSYDKSIKLVDIKKKAIIKDLYEHRDWVLTIKIINHSKYGNCLISQGRRKDQIKIWKIDT